MRGRRGQLPPRPRPAPLGERKAILFRTVFAPWYCTNRRTVSSPT